MSIGRIMQKAVTVLRSTKAGAKVAANSAKVVAKPINAAKNILPKANVQPSILSRVESNTSGRILRMQDAKKAFTPRTPYQTTVTHESVPTMQKIEEITGVSRGKVADTTGYFDKKRAADALAAFRQEPVAVKYGTYTPNYQQTQKVLDELHGVVKTDAIKAYERTGKLADLPKDLVRKILDAQAAFSGDLSKTTPNWAAKMDYKLDNMIMEHQKKWDAILTKQFKAIDTKFAEIMKFKKVSNL